MAPLSLRKRIKNNIDNNIYFFNALRTGTRMLKEYRQEGRQASAENYYDNFSADDLNKMLFALDEIAKLAGNRTVSLFTIPMEGDAVYALENGYSFRLVAELSSFAARRDNVRYLDLLPAYLDYAAKNQVALSDFRLDCDPHWSRLGNEVAAQAVFEFALTD